MPSSFIRKTWTAAALCAALPLAAFAARVPKARPKLSPEALLGREALAEIIQADSSPDSEVRADAAAAWGRIGNRAASPMLEKMLKDGDDSVRLAAANSLYALGDRKAFAVILAMAQASPEASENPTPIEQLRLMAKNRLRINAIEDLRAIGKADPKLGVKAVRVFETTQNDPSGPVRDATAIALAGMGLDEFAPRFLTAAKDQDAAVRAEAVRALGEIGTLDAVSAVASAASDSDSGVRAAAMSAARDFAASDAAPILAQGMKDSDPDVKAKALESLSALDDAASVPVLRQAYDAAPDLSTQMIALAGLARRGQAPDSSSILPALKSSDEDIRKLGIEILGLSKDAPSLALLKTQMEKDDSPALRVLAAEMTLRRLESAKSRSRP